MRPCLVCVTTLPALGVALALQACGGGESTSPAPTTTDRTQTTETSPSALRKALKDTSRKPVIPTPTGSPPRRLVKEDLVKGKGPPARPGDSLTVQFVGVTFSTGEEFGDSWKTGRPYMFTLGRNGVIKGWDRGLAGMRKGGRRMLTIPPEQAYGRDGAPPGIGPNETLVYVFDLLRIRRS